MFFETYKVILTKHFVNELGKIVDYYYEVAHAGVAHDFVDSVERVTSSLNHMPLRHSVSHFDSQFRKVKAGKYPYIIHYEVIEDTVLILDIFHGHKKLQK